MPRSSIIIPVFNQAALTHQCLQTLIAQGTNELIVVDDASTDNTPQLLESYRDRVRVIKHSENQGFAAACNHGAAVATGQYLVFLNNDTIPQPSWLEALENHADLHSQAAVVGSKLLYPDERVQHAGVVICQDRYPRHLYRGFPAAHPAVRKSRRFQIVTGACMLVRREAFEAARGFDPAFRNGFEDVDLCLRLGCAGFEVHYCAESVLHHLESVSPGRLRRARANVALYRERWLSRVHPDDFEYYAADGLIRLTYEGDYPLGLEVSPLLACVDDNTRRAELEHRLRDLGRAVAELARENTKLSVELGNKDQHSPALRYQALRRELRKAIEATVPPGSRILVVSKGDSALLDFSESQGWHFPQTEWGAYVGHHPESSTEAIAHLESLRAKGADYLLIPEPSLWWLDYYHEFRHHCEAHYARLTALDGIGVLYGLKTLTKAPVVSCDVQKSD
ncbi:MAG TPA: glycosyltransferase family 2 protein [Candidatus Limnocylindrales bacterium]|nr:glycosyltransferase family 2 protein [Candidatus Limnocylindrales bacterium]